MRMQCDVDCVSVKAKRYSPDCVCVFCKPLTRLQLSRSTWLPLPWKQLNVNHVPNEWMQWVLTTGSIPTLFCVIEPDVCKWTKSKYRQQVLILYFGTQGEPRASLCTIPMKCFARFCKGAKCTDTGGRFRSYVLRVMSPARFLCATPVLHYRV